MKLFFPIMCALLACNALPQPYDPELRAEIWAVTLGFNSASARCLKPQIGDAITRCIIVANNAVIQADCFLPGAGNLYTLNAENYCYVNYDR